MKEQFSILKSCQKDKKRGSQAIVYDILEQATNILQNSTPKDILKLKNSLNTILKTQSSMAIVINVCYKLLNLCSEALTLRSNIKERRNSSLSRYSSRFTMALESVKTDIKNASMRCIEKAINIIKARKICTISYSNEVLEVILLIKPQVVYVAIGHPKKEGLNLALELKKHSINTIVFEDNNYQYAVKESDCVLCGADAILEHVFINKSGTFMLALLANYFEKPFYLIANRYKKLNENTQKYFKINSMPKSEITNVNIDTYNVYFEEVPLNLAIYLGD